MLAKVLRKEFSLAMHPTCILMLFLSAMVLIPNYPYSVIFFYTALGLLFTSLLGRENNDVVYSLTLPIAKKDIVKGRFAFSILLELAQILLMIPFFYLRQSIYPLGNQAGVDANIALFGYAFLLFGIFNFVFFTRYYKNVNQVGSCFVISMVVFFIVAGVLEACSHFVPVLVNYTETLDPQFLGYKLAVLGIGFVLYLIFTMTAYKKSVSLFEKQDV